jgi:RNA polymerase sporulation-specific sigma factor
MPAFTEEEWVKALNRMTIYAQRIFIRLGWWRNGSFESPRGHKPEEIACEAITRVLSGPRNYDARKCPDFYQYLRGVVRSIISHIVGSSDFKRRMSIPSATTSEEETIEIKQESKEVDPLQACIEKEQVDINKNLIRKVESVLEKDFSEDKIVIGIYECYKAGIYKRSELAEYLEVDVKEIDNAQKRLRRKMDKLFQT